MADVFSKDERSAIMSRVRSDGNKSTEIKLISVFSELNIHGWQRKYKVIGHPDFVFLSLRIAVFVDGCFWHGHDCRNTKPANNADYWKNKLERNKAHDQEITDRFLSRGWLVIRIWECELTKKNRGLLLDKLKPILQQNIQNNE